MVQLPGLCTLSKKIRTISQMEMSTQCVNFLMRSTKI